MSEDLDNEENQPSLNDAIFVGTTLPEIHGEIIALVMLCRETMKAMKRAGILNDEQLEEFFVRASKEVDERCNPANSKSPDAVEVFGRIKESALSRLQKIKEAAGD